MVGFVGKSTYKIPKPINATNDIFLLALICNFHSIAIGRVAKNMSLVIETTARVASDMYGVNDECSCSEKVRALLTSASPPKSMYFLYRPANCLDRVVPDYSDIFALKQESNETRKCPREDERHGAVDDSAVDTIWCDAKQEKADRYLDHARCPKKEDLTNKVEFESHLYRRRVKIGRVSTRAVCDLAQGDTHAC